MRCVMGVRNSAAAAACQNAPVRAPLQTAGAGTCVLRLSWITFSSRPSPIYNQFLLVTLILLCPLACPHRTFSHGAGVRRHPSRHPPRRQCRPVGAVERPVPAAGQHQGGARRQPAGAVGRRHAVHTPADGGAAGHSFHRHQPGQSLPCCRGLLFTSEAHQLPATAARARERSCGGSWPHCWCL